MKSFNQYLIEDGIISCDQPIWARTGKWVTYKQYLTEGGLIIKEPHADGYGHKINYITDIIPQRAGRKSKKGKVYEPEIKGHHLHFNDNVKNFLEHEIPEFLWKPFIFWIQNNGIMGASAVIDKIAKELKVPFYKIIRSIEREDENYPKIRQLFNQYKGQPKDVVLKASGRGGVRLYHVPLNKLDLLKFVAHANVTGDYGAEVGPDPDNEDESNTKGVFTGGVGQYRDPDKGHVTFAGGYMPRPLDSYTTGHLWSSVYGPHFEQSKVGKHPPKNFNVSKINNESVLTPVNLPALYNQGWTRESKYSHKGFNEEGKKLVGRKRTKKTDENDSTKMTLYKDGLTKELVKKNGMWYSLDWKKIYDERGDLNPAMFEADPVMHENPKLSELPPWPVNPSGVEEYRLHGKHKSDFEKIWYSAEIQKLIGDATNRYSGQKKQDAQTEIFVYLSSKYRKLPKDIASDIDKAKKYIGSAVSAFSFKDKPTSVGQTDSGEEDTNYDVSDKQHAARLGERKEGEDTTKKFSLRGHHEVYNQILRVAYKTAIKVWAHCLYENKFKDLINLSNLEKLNGKKNPLKKEPPKFNNISDAETWLKDEENFLLDDAVQYQIKDTLYNYGLPEDVFEHYKNILLGNNEIEPHASLTKVEKGTSPALYHYQTEKRERLSKLAQKHGGGYFGKRQLPEDVRNYNFYKDKIENIFNSSIDEDSKTINLNEIIKKVQNLISTIITQLNIGEGGEILKQRKENGKIQILEFSKTPKDVEDLVYAAFYDYLIDELSERPEMFNEKEKNQIINQMINHYGLESKVIKKLKDTTSINVSNISGNPVIQSNQKEKQTKTAIDHSFNSIIRKIIEIKDPNKLNAEDRKKFEESKKLYLAYKEQIKKIFQKHLTNSSTISLSEMSKILGKFRDDEIEYQFEQLDDLNKELTQLKDFNAREKFYEEKIIKLKSEIREIQFLIHAAYHDYLLQLIKERPDILTDENKIFLDNEFKKYSEQSDIYKYLNKQIW